MRRSLPLVLIAALAVAIAVPASASAGASPDAQATVAKGKKGAKKKAAKCKTAKKKAKGKGKARKSLAAADAAAKGKAKGKKKAKRKCGKAKAKPKATPKRSPKSRSRNPAERNAERLRERREALEEAFRNRPKPLTHPDVTVADGSYSSTSAPGLSVTISGNSSQARVTYTVPKSAFDTTCQPHTEGEAVDITGPIEISQSTKRGHLMLHASQPVNPAIGASKSQSVTGSIGKDGSFSLSIQASFPYPPDQGATCSAFPGAQLTGTLVKQ